MKNTHKPQPTDAPPPHEETDMKQAKPTAAEQENAKWFVLRVSYGRIAKAIALIEDKRIEHHTPMRYKETIHNGKRTITTEPLLPSFVFAHSTHAQIDALIQAGCTSAAGFKPLLSFYYDHTAFRRDAPHMNPPLIIPDAAMDNFIRLTSTQSPHVIPVTSGRVKYKLGDEVAITEGKFKGVHGKVARIAGQQRVVIELFEGCLVATAYIPQCALKPYMPHNDKKHSKR